MGMVDKINSWLSELIMRRRFFDNYSERLFCQAMKAVF